MPPHPSWPLIEILSFCVVLARADLKGEYCVRPESKTCCENLNEDITIFPNNQTQNRTCPFLCDVPPIDCVELLKKSFRRGMTDLGDFPHVNFTTALAGLISLTMDGNLDVRLRISLNWMVDKFGWDEKRCDVSSRPCRSFLDATNHLDYYEIMPEKDGIFDFNLVPAYSFRLSKQLEDTPLTVFRNGSVLWRGIHSRKDRVYVTSSILSFRYAKLSHALDFFDAGVTARKCSSLRRQIFAHEKFTLGRD